uniref:(northern house mosquito) hypothetical protein n=1 Tax=Culex pipiens TaxID=7175 RepID=A0A8D8PDE4_CULPI
MSTFTQSTTPTTRSSTSVAGMASEIRRPSGKKPRNRTRDFLQILMTTTCWRRATNRRARSNCRGTSPSRMTPDRSFASALPTTTLSTPPRWAGSAKFAVYRRMPP